MNIEERYVALDAKLDQILAKASHSKLSLFVLLATHAAVFWVGTRF